MSVDRARVSNTVAVGAASVPVVDADVSRSKLIFSNDHATQVIYLQLGTGDPGTAPTAIVGQGIRLAPGGPPFTLEDYYGPVNAIASGAATGLCIVEL